MKSYIGRIHLESVVEQMALNDALVEYADTIANLNDSTFDDLKREVGCVADIVEHEFESDKPTENISVPQQEIVLPQTHGVLALAVLIVAKSHSENPTLQQMCGTMVAEYRDSQEPVSFE